MPSQSAVASAGSAPTEAAVVSSGGTHEIAAACIGCTGDERTARQAGIDTLVSRLAAINDDSCNDTTDTFDGEPIARVGCSYAGGFSVDYILWADEPSMSAFTALFTGISEAVIQEWYLFGDAGPRTGQTVEWLQDGAARFYWTYDEFLISANAALPTGEQDRLNDWWRTTASLMRES